MKIKEARKARKMSQKELADALGLKRSSVSMWEIGASTPSASQLGEICRILDVSSDYLLDLPTSEKKALPSKEALSSAIPPETYEKLASDTRKLKLACWIAVQDEATLTRLERLLSAIEDMDK